MHTHMHTQNNHLNRKRLLGWKLNVRSLSPGPIKWVLSFTLSIPNIILFVLSMPFGSDYFLGPQAIRLRCLFTTISGSKNRPNMLPVKGCFVCHTLSHSHLVKEIRDCIQNAEYCAPILWFLLTLLLFCYWQCFQNERVASLHCFEIWGDDIGYWPNMRADSRNEVAHGRTELAGFILWTWGPLH